MKREKLYIAGRLDELKKQARKGLRTEAAIVVSEIVDAAQLRVLR